MKKGLIFALILIVAAQAAYIYYSQKVDYGMNTLDILLETMDPRNGMAERLLDEVGVSSIEDIHYSQDHEKITLTFGQFKFDLKKDDLVTPEMRTKLKKLGLDTYVNPEGEVKFKYYGDIIKEVLP